MNIWAKSIKKKCTNKSITLLEHIHNALRAFNNLKNKIPPDVQKAIEYSIVFHDLGKVLPSFQRELGNKKYEPFDVIIDIPHSLFSVFWINEDELKNKLGEETAKFIISAVAFHHWRPYFDELLLRSSPDFIRFAERINGFKDKLGQNLLNEFQGDQELQNYSKFIKFDERKLEGIKNGRAFYNYAIPSYKFYWLPERIETGDERKQILISGFLQKCDHFASFCEEENEQLDKVEISNIKSESIKSKVKDKLKLDENKIWQFQKVNPDKNTILVAPTGYGKTEFAFLWSGGEKFFYTLPLRAAVNQIFERAKEIFDDNNTQRTGLLHSDADIYLLGSEKDVADNLKLYDLARQLSFPAIISTGDQFFPYALKPPGYEKIYATFSYSRLVIDEVQAYDPKACAIIVKFAEDIVRMGGKFLLMTATLPEFVKDEITKRVKKIIDLEPTVVNVYQEKKETFEQIKKHKVKIEIKDFTDDVVKDMSEKAKEGKRILVILNTVEQAQEVYEKLREQTKNEGIKIFLLHAKYTSEDRRKREIMLSGIFQNPKPENEKEGRILVATQVVEASLNIDADILFTEICPLDALVQRMGRVWRRYGPQEDTSKIKPPDEPNVYIMVPKKELESEGKMVYEKELLKLSLAWLWRLSQPGFSEISIPGWKKEEEMKSFLSQNFSELLSLKRNKKKRQENVYDDLIKGEWLDKLSNLKVLISEYEKYKVVSYFYSTLRPGQGYLSKFYKTLEILDAGYISDSKIEAEKIFREIYDVNIIPQAKFDDFSNATMSFLKQEDQSYTKFKKDVISKFVVSIPYERHKVDYDNWVFYKLQEKDIFQRIKEDIKETCCQYQEKPEEVVKRYESKFKRWLAGIFVLDWEYDEDIGLKRKAKQERQPSDTSI